MSKLNMFGKKNFWDVFEKVCSVLTALFILFAIAYMAIVEAFAIALVIVFFVYISYAWNSVTAIRGPWNKKDWQVVACHFGNSWLILAIAAFTYPEEASVRFVPIFLMASSYIASWIFNQMYLEMLNHPSLMNWNNGFNFDELSDFMAENDLMLVTRLEGNDKLFEKDGEIWLWRNKTNMIEKVEWRWDFGFLVKD